jgi:hypothetical protein
MILSASLRRANVVSAPSPIIWLFGSIATAWLAVQSPVLIYFACLLSILVWRFPNTINYFITHPWFQRIGKMRTVAILGGTLVFATIALHGDPAHAQLFKNAEQQTNGIFGSYIDPSIVKFMFGLLRVVVWISAVGFVLFAVYQAQRGEQWQPLMQNAFIVIAAVVVVEGLSSLFFGGAAGGGARAGG